MVALAYKAIAATVDGRCQSAPLCSVKFRSPRAFTWFEPASFVFLLAVASWLGVAGVCGLVALSLFMTHEPP